MNICLKRAFFIYTRLFDPFAVICATYLLIFTKYGRFPQDLKLLLFVILLNIVIPIFYFVSLIRSRRVANWDVTNKTDRRKLLGPLIIFIVISTVIIYIFTLFAVLSVSGTSLFNYLLRFQFAGILLFSYLYFVSPFFKSSGHVGTISMAAPFILKMMGMNYWWVIILILIQAIARVKLGKHTWQEVTVGFISGIAIGTVAVLL